MVMNAQAIWLYHVRADSLPVAALRVVMEAFGVEVRAVRMTNIFDLPGKQETAVIVWSRSCRPLDIRTWLLKFDTDMREPGNRRLAVVDLCSQDRAFLGYLSACGAVCLPITNVVAGLLAPCAHSFAPIPISLDSPLRKTIQDHCGHGQVEFDSVAALLSSIMPKS